MSLCSTFYLEQYKVESAWKKKKYKKTPQKTKRFSAPSLMSHLQVRWTIIMEKGPFPSFIFKSAEGL